MNVRTIIMVIIMIMVLLAVLIELGVHRRPVQKGKRYAGLAPRIGCGWHSRRAAHKHHELAPLHISEPKVWRSILIDGF